MTYSSYTCHIVIGQMFFELFTSRDGAVHAGKNETIASLGTGTVRLFSIVDGVQHLVTQNDAIYAPEIMYDLICISKVRERNFRIIIYEDECCWEMEKVKVLRKPS